MYCDRDNEPRQMSIFQQRAHIICFCCIILATALDLLHALGSMATNTTLHLLPIVWIHIVQTMATTIYYVYALLIYVILFQRLHCTFKGTVYRLSRWTVGFLIVTMTVQYINMLCYSAGDIINNFIIPIYNISC